MFKILNCQNIISQLKNFRLSTNKLSMPIVIGKGLKNYLSFLSLKKIDVQKNQSLIPNRIL